MKEASIFKIKYRVVLKIIEIVQVIYTVGPVSDSWSFLE